MTREFRRKKLDANDRRARKYNVNTQIFLEQVRESAREIERAVMQYEVTDCLNIIIQGEESYGGRHKERFRQLGLLDLEQSDYSVKCMGSAVGWGHVV